MSSNENKWIVEFGNPLYIKVFIVFALFTVIGCFYAHSLTFLQAKSFLLRYNLLALCIMVPYRFYLVFDHSYMDMVYPNAKKPYLFELPFFPCNTVELLICFAIVFESRLLLAYCFFMGFIGPIVALAIPPAGFQRENLWSIRMLGFFLTHFITLSTLPFMIFSHFYIPTYFDVCLAVGMYTVVSFLMYLLNNYIDSLHLGHKANYFFVSDPTCNPIFNLCYKWIPIPFVYSLPVVALCGVISSILVLIIHLFV